MVSRFDVILNNLRRRDNIRGFIHGLHESECWPYPNGEEQPIPATWTCDGCIYPVLTHVELCEEKGQELMHLFITNVSTYHPFAPFNRQGAGDSDLTDMSLDLWPEEGPGAYVVQYEKVDKRERIHTVELNLQQVATLRLAFMHRYEWVVNKLHSVNRDRREAGERSVQRHESEQAIGSDTTENEGPLSEEEDHDARLCEEEDQDDEEEDSIMAEDHLDVATKPLVRPSQMGFRREAISSDIQRCDQAWHTVGPVKEPNPRLSRRGGHFWNDRDRRRRPPS